MDPPMGDVIAERDGEDKRDDFDMHDTEAQQITPKPRHRRTSKKVPA